MQFIKNQIKNKSLIQTLEWNDLEKGDNGEKITHFIKNIEGDPGPWVTNFRKMINALTKGKVEKPGSVHVGSDPFGNRYFEIPADPR